MAVIAVIAGISGMEGIAAAYETDQYSNRLVPLADSQPILERVVNEALLRVAAGWRGGADRYGFTLAVFHELGGLHWVDRIERLAIESPEIQRLPQMRHHSIYDGLPFTARRVNFVFGVGSTIRLAGVLTGTDKLGHFFSQGKKYYFSRLAGWREEHILGRGKFNERWLFGQLTTSVYSNADLVANYEGYLFYRSLYEDGIVPGKSAIVRFAGDRAVVTRPFSWGDHVSDYWDEALHPSHMSRELAKSMQQAILGICADYALAPERFRVRDEAVLRERYAAIGLKPAAENSVPVVCGSAAAASAGR
ncbi:MAG: hypothetical protein ABIV06_08700, partial [Thermoanaerobaculia bacterium]